MGAFDPLRLIDGLKVVVDPSKITLEIGLEYSAIHAAEALLLARYFYVYAGLLPRCAKGL
jgi:HD superfamily phosphohydrolase